MGILGAGYITEEEAGHLLEMLVDSDAVELQILPEKKEAEKKLVRIPYMMNDAVEYYLEIEGCIIRGSWETEEGTEEFSFVQNGASKGLILRQLSGNIVTIWYQNILRVAECYQYHMIGHNWRKISGEENLRRLVNLLCVMHDKVTYLGGEFCNEQEKEWYRLAEFGPLRYFSPITESILEWYPESEEGACAMIRLAKKAGDDGYVRLLEKYLEDLRNGKRLERRITSLAKELLHRSHFQIYQVLEEEIRKASESWKVRDYGQKINEEIQRYRRQTEENYKKLGYEGCYPLLVFKRGNTKQILQFFEEHPFTVLEYADYEFRIFSMKYQEEHPFAIELKKEER